MQRRPLPSSAPPTSSPAAPPADAAAWAAEREHLLELLAQAQRAAQTGLLTSGVFHDVNNHLAVMSGSAYLARQSDDPEAWRAALDAIQEQCTTVADTVRAFQSFVKRRATRSDKTYRLSDAAAQAVRLTAILAKRSDVDVSSNIEADGTVTGDLRLATQALVNLVANAIQACAGTRGQVEITTLRPKPGMYRIRVQDTGPGVPEDVRPRLFRPFVTSRDSSGGHGLGLFVVRQTVRQMGGTIRVRTGPGGTTFTIDLPAS